MGNHPVYQCDDALQEEEAILHHQRPEEQDHILLLVKKCFYLLFPQVVLAIGLIVWLPLLIAVSHEGRQLQVVPRIEMER